MEVTQLPKATLEMTHKLDVSKLVCLNTSVFASPVFVSSRLSRCLSPTPRMYVMTQ